MSKIVQWKRGNANVSSTYTGFDGEITVNTDSYNLHVHDGTTQGGHIVGNTTGNLSITNQTIAGTISNANIILQPLNNGAIRSNAQFASFGLDARLFVQTLENTNVAVITTTSRAGGNKDLYLGGNLSLPAISVNPSAPYHVGINQVYDPGFTLAVSGSTYATEYYAAANFPTGYQFTTLDGDTGISHAYQTDSNGNVSLIRIRHAGEETVRFYDNLTTSVTGNLTVSQDGATYGTFPNAFVQVYSNVDSYSQFVMQNVSANPLASSDIVITGDDGDDVSHYLDIGMASSTYNYPGFGIIKPDDSYILAVGDDSAGPGSTENANLILGSTNGNVKVFVGAAEDANLIASFSTTGFVPGANVTYSLGSAASQWKDLWVSNNTIYIGGVALSVDANGNLTVNGNVISGGGGSFNQNLNTFNSPQFANLTINGSITGNTIRATTNEDDLVSLGLNTSGDSRSVSVGSYAGSGAISGQSYGAVSVGWSAGAGQGGARGIYTVAVGMMAGYNVQGNQSVAIGDNAGVQYQGARAVALGGYAGSSNQGANAVAIGYSAGYNNQPADSIVINATGQALGGVASGFVVKPIRSASSGNVLYYNANSGEITFGSANTSGLGNFVFNGNSLLNLNGGSFTNGDLSHGATASLILPANGDTSAVQLINTYGGFDIIAGINANITGTWSFDGTGDLNFPGGTFAGNNIEATGNFGFETPANVGFGILADAGSQEWVFGTDGNLTLPSGGSIYSEPYTPSGAPGNTIVLQPAGAGVATGQRLLVYPTAADGDHIHLTSGNLYQTELFLGSDNLYVKLENTGNVVINSNDNNGNVGTWTFDYSGNITVPGSIIAEFVTSPAPRLSGFDVIGADLITANNITANSFIGNIQGPSTVFGNLNITGNLIVAGNTTTVSTNNFVVSDNIIFMANNNPANILDIGFAAHYTTDILRHTGFVKDIADGTWKLFSNVPQEITTEVNFTEAIYDPIQTGNITAPYFIGNGSALTGINTDSTQIINGNSNVTIDSTGNISFTLNGANFGHIQYGGGVAIGATAGNSNQGLSAVAIGSGAATENQGYHSVAIGWNVGQYNQGTSSIAIGENPAFAAQGNSAIAIGAVAARSGQGNYAIAMGTAAGYSGQSANTVAIGTRTGQYTQGENAVAVGLFAGNSGQGNGAVAIGPEAGKTSQGIQSTAIGIAAGSRTQGNGSVALGSFAGQYDQKDFAIAIGSGAAASGQGYGAIAIGVESTTVNQGDYSIAIGFTASNGNLQPNNSIIIDATNTQLAATGPGLFVSPVRNDVGNISQIVTYNTTTKEITYSNTISIAGNITAGNISSNVNGFAIGYRDVPQVVFTSNATLALTDAGKHYFSSNSANVITIPNNTTVSFNIGTAISIIQQGSANLTVTPGSGVTLYLAGNSTSSSRTLGNYGMATLMKVGTDTWFINGTGVN